jgi:hypothetical protein
VEIEWQKKVWNNWTGVAEEITRNNNWKESSKKNEKGRTVEFLPVGLGGG